MQNKRTNLFWIFLISLLATIVGAILWKLGLETAFDWILDIIFRLIFVIFKTVKNKIYQDAAKNVFEAWSILHYSIFLGIIWLFFYLFGLAYVIWNKDGKTKAEKLESFLDYFFNKSRRIFNIGVILFGIFVWLSMYRFLISNYSRSVNVYSKNAIILLAPKISEETHLTLKGEFISIKNAEDFYVFHKKLLKLADSTGIKLPDFKPL